jgi:hypothetical protein
LIRPSFLELFNKDKPLNPYWVSGFIEGDGSFYINIKNRGSVASVSAVLAIDLHIREEPLLFKIKEFFGSLGNVYISKNRKVVQFKMSKIQSRKRLITILPHFKIYPLIGLKLYNFGIWKEIVFLIEEKAHLTDEGLEKIKSFKNKLNLWCVSVSPYHVSNT